MEKYLKMKNPQNFEIDRNSKKSIKNFPKTKKENIKQNKINNSKHSKANTYMKNEIFLIIYIFHNIFNLFLIKILIFMNLFMPAFLKYTIKVTLVKSPIGAIPKHRKTVEALGLTKMHRTVELPNNAATKGMIKQVEYLLKVEE